MKAIIGFLLSVLTGKPRYPRKYKPSVKIGASEAYWIWEEHLIAELEPDATIENSRDIIPYWPLRGFRLPDNFPQLQLKVRGRRPVPDFFQISIYRFISTRLKQHLEEMHVPGFECRPVRITQKGKVLNDTHFYFHVYQTVDCLDLIHSNYEVDTGPKGPYVSRIRELHLDESKIGDDPLFKIGTPGAEYNLMVSDSLAESLLRAKFIGCGFKLPADIEKYYDAPRYKTLSA